MIDDERRTLRLDVNGDKVEVAVRGHHTLLDVLRRELDLFGARPGCTAGVCGSCTVLLDGAPVSSCLLPAELVGARAVRTIEDLAGVGRLHPVQQAFIDHTAFQCSYCTPGFILTTVALLAAEPEADRERIRAELAGNLCRCGSYVKIMEAALDARDRMRPSPPTGEAETRPGPNPGPGAETYVGLGASKGTDPGAGTCGGGGCGADGGAGRCT